MSAENVIEMHQTVGEIFQSGPMNVFLLCHIYHSFKKKKEKKNSMTPWTSLFFLVKRWAQEWGVIPDGDREERDVYQHFYGFSAFSWKGVLRNWCRLCHWKTLYVLPIFSDLAQLVGSYLDSCRIHKLHKLRETGKGRERGDSVMFCLSWWIKREGKENSPTMIPHVYFMTRFLSK